MNWTIQVKSEKQFSIVNVRTNNFFEICNSNNNWKQNFDDILGNISIDSIALLTSVGIYILEVNV